MACACLSLLVTPMNASCTTSASAAEDALSTPHKRTMICGQR
jgi:hypothetical protein